MVNSLRRYHLGCGERLQAHRPFAMIVNKLTDKDSSQSKQKDSVNKKKAQH